MEAAKYEDADPQAPADPARKRRYGEHGKKRPYVLQSPENPFIISFLIVEEGMFAALRIEYVPQNRVTIAPA